MQYGMTHGLVLLLNDCTVQQPYNRRFPPVLLRFFRYRRYGINLGFTIKIMGSKSEIKWLKTIDNLCLVVKYSSMHRPARISGNDLLRRSDNIYIALPALLTVGSYVQPPRQSTDQVSIHVRFGIQAEERESWR